MKSWVSLAIFVVAAGINYAAWWQFHQPATGAYTDGRVDGISYSPYRSGQSPIENRQPSEAEIAEDLQQLRGLTSEIRTYSATDVQENIPDLAARQGMDVMVGAWIDKDTVRNEEEISALIRLARKPNVKRLVVGNEAVLREDVKVGELVRMIKAVRRQVRKPVSTAEPWHVWVKHPELAAAVDFIAVHILPYWEGIPVANSVDAVFERMKDLRAAFPGKPIVITEVGWPSVGRKIGAAVASPATQAWFLREFVSRAEAKRLDYFIVEAYDQPWKASGEGQAGGYWGMFDLERQPKFTWAGPIVRRIGWEVWAGIAIAFGLLPAFAYLRRRDDIAAGGKFAFTLLCQGAGSAMAFTLLLPFERYMDPLAGGVWAALFAAQSFLFILMVIDAIECVDVVAFRGKSEISRPPRSAPWPKVSIHVAAYNEPPAMMKETLQALARLDYPNFEVLVVDNNTKDPAVWRPVQDFCAELGPRFRFFHLEPWPGFKAGALNFALKETAADAEVVAVIDADYQVTPDWLRALVPSFDEPDVAIVQAPQDYRDGAENLFKAFCFWEYVGFFKIGMVQRARDNAIIQHGTMTMVRRRALEEVGAWSEWCITEDAELGLRLFEDGWRCVYTPRSYGRGVMPDSLDAYVRQRFRWAYGAVQILKRHWRQLISPRSRLTAAQRYHFVAGWVPWWADAAGLVFGAFALLWTVASMIWPKYIEYPEISFVMPALGVVVFKVLRDVLLYRVRVNATLTDSVAAMIAGLALTHTVGKAMIIGLFTAGRPFLRTPKCENRPNWYRALAMARTEATILFVELAIIAAFLVHGKFHDLEARLWLAALCVLTLPYIAAVAMSVINASGIGASWESILRRANSFGTEKALGGASAPTST